MKRIFIAIKMSQKIQQEAEKWKAEFLNLPVRWIPADNLHITLIPPWDEDEENIEIIANALEKIQGKISPFEIRFNNITYGPNPFSPRLIWAEGRAAEDLIKLQREVENLLYVKLDRKFKLHLTLARFRQEDYVNFAIKNLNEKIDWIEKVDSICLIESILKPEGAEYVVLERVSL